MRHYITRYKAGSRRALLIFTGWGMDHRPAEAVGSCLPGYDVLTAYDYAAPEDLSGDQLASSIMDYDDVVMVAWSFGVAHASLWMQRHSSVNIGLRVAVNGTLTPVDAATGINPGVFEATLTGLSHESLAKFRLRMCGSRLAYAAFTAALPDRTLESLAAELEQMRQLSSKPIPRCMHDWDHVIIGTADRIFMPDNQRRAWSAHGAVTMVEGMAHMPDWNVVGQMVADLKVDKQRMADRFSRAAVTYDDNAPVQRQMASKLASMLPYGIGGNVIEIGAGTGLFTAELMPHLDAEVSLRRWDIAPVDDGVERLDAENAISAVGNRSVTMVTGASVLQWLQSPQRFLAQCRRVIVDGGMAAFATFGPATYAEIDRIIGAPVHPYPTADQWRRMALEAGWSDVEAVARTLQLKFATPADVLRHMRLTGVGARRSESTSTRNARRLLAGYERDQAGDYPLTYQPVYLILR